MASTQMKMKPMFLPGVEQNPQPGPYAEMIRRAQESGGEYWKIWNLFAFRPEATAHLARFTHAVMHEDAPLTPALRELIAAYTSFQNECEFCAKSHAAIAAELIGNEELVWNALRDLEIHVAVIHNEHAYARQPLCIQIVKLGRLQDVCKTGGPLRYRGIDCVEEC